MQTRSCCTLHLLVEGQCKDAKQCYNIRAVVQERVQSTLEFGWACFVGTLITLQVGNCIPRQLCTFSKQHSLSREYNMKQGGLV